MKASCLPAILATCCALAAGFAAVIPAVCADGSAQAERLAFDVTEGATLNSFLREGEVAAHLVLRGGPRPRVVIAFPAGNSGVGIWFSPTAEPVTWTLDERPQPITLNDAQGRPLRGIVTRVTATVPALSIRQVILSGIRVLRDYQTFDSLPPQIEVAAVEHRRSLVWARNRLDGAPGYRLTLEVTHGQLTGGRITADPDGRIGMTVTALSGDTPLTPRSAAELLDHPARANRAARNVLTFLSYREKFLAGSWRYDTYFGRDTLMSMRLLMPALSPAAVEDGLGSVLGRLSPGGEVAHEEEIGESALLDHLNADGTLSDAPLFDYRMIDGTFMLAPVIGAWLLEDPRASAGAAAFLARTDDGYGRAPRTFGAALVANLRFVIQSAGAFAADPQARHLISLKEGLPWGQWRDSDAGIAHGRYPFDVNAVLVPAALEAAARLYDGGLLAPYVSEDDRAALSRAAHLAAIWRARATDFFDVDVGNEAARRRIDAYARSVGVPADAALRSIGRSAVTFHALALDVDGSPIPILHSDEGYELLFGSPGNQPIETALAAVMRPFPAGLLTDVGVVVANPVFATPELQALFTNKAYHGTVIWSWQQAVLAAGLARQLGRPELPGPLKQRLRLAQRRLWRAIGEGRHVINSELWSWSYRNGHYAIVPFGTAASNADESNAAQLWSTVYLAIHPPPPGPGRRHTAR